MAPKSSKPGTGLIPAPTQLNWFAIGVGLLTDIMASFAFRFLITMIVFMVLSFQGLSVEEITRHFERMIQTGQTLWIDGFARLLSAFFAGWMAARLSRRLVVWNAMAVGIMVLLLDLLIMTASDQLGFFSLFISILGIIAASFGGNFYKRRNPQ